MPVFPTAPAHTSHDAPRHWTHTVGAWAVILLGPGLCVGGLVDAAWHHHPKWLLGWAVLTLGSMVTTTYVASQPSPRDGC